MLGLLVGQNGYPIGYDIFEGNTFEGYTLLPVLEDIQGKYLVKKPIVIADAALLSKKNLANLNEEGYQFIIGARIKNETDKVEEDERWDGLKGYVTNTRLSPKNIVENYRHLWQIEKAFRISKTDLRIRPIHHYRKNV